MTDLAIALFPVLSPVIAGILIGVGWARWSTPVEPEAITPLILNVGTPCLVFSTLATLSVPPVQLGIMVVVIIMMLAIFFGACRLLLVFVGLPSAVYLPSLVFGNLGNLGLPLNLYAFGDAGLELALIMFAMQSMLFFTVHIWLMSGTGSPLTMLRAPHVYAIGAALAFTLTDTVPPAWLTNATDLIGGLTIPMMLILLGASLVKLKIVSLARPLVLAVLRVVLGLGVAMLICRVLPLEATARGVVTICCCMPGAVFNYLAAVKFNRSPDEVASYVVLSTLVVLVLLPLLVPLAWWMAG